MTESSNKLEPDGQVIREDQARSAILFGPPGASKTTLVRALADFIEWDYVEIHASHFVAEGLPEVQKTADKIFRQLSELDHAVVLFDEIDELVRERNMEKDAFGRFLTTSMLPKLAELWEARKILYFVATNHINYFDSAIIRSHRFDALILVSPPSFRAKTEELVRLLSEVHGISDIRFEIVESDVQQKLDAIDTAANQNKKAGDWGKAALDDEHMLAKFALLRWDELNELAYRLASILSSNKATPIRVDANLLQQALKQIDDSEWRKNQSYLDYLRDRRSERRDYQMLNVWEVKKGDSDCPPEVLEQNGSKWLPKAADKLSDIKIAGFDLVPAPPGGVEIRDMRPK
jgi:SpoVK/Ycf46/Vps4 family AAA+-type ATPase